MSKIFLTPQIQDEVARQVELLVSGFGDRMDVSALWNSFGDAEFKRLRREHKLAVDRLCRVLLKQKKLEDREKTCLEAKTVHLVFVFDRIEMAVAFSQEVLNSIRTIEVPDSTALDQFVTDLIIARKDGGSDGLQTNL